MHVIEYYYYHYSLLLRFPGALCIYVNVDLSVLNLSATCNVKISSLETNFVITDFADSIWPTNLGISTIYLHSKPGNSVGVATDYRLDGPGSNPVGDEIFRSSRPALGPTQSPVKWAVGLSRG